MGIKVFHVIVRYTQLNVSLLSEKHKTTLDSFRFLCQQLDFESSPHHAYPIYLSSMEGRSPLSKLSIAGHFHLTSNAFFSPSVLYLIMLTFTSCYKIRAEGSGNPLQYYCLGKPMDSGAWQAKSRTRLSNFTIGYVGFSGGASGKEPACQCRRCKRHGFNLLVRKIPWGRAWQPTPVFLPGESHGQSSLVGYSL